MPPSVLTKVRKLARRRKETSIQTAVLGVFRAYGIVCYPMNREKGGRNRASHVGFKGLPDIGGVIAKNGRAFYAEVKRPGEPLSPHQVGALRMLAKAKAFTCLVHDVDEALQAAKEATRTPGEPR